MQVAVLLLHFFHCILKYSHISAEVLTTLGTREFFANLYPHTCVYTFIDSKRKCAFHHIYIYARTGTHAHLHKLREREMERMNDSERKKKEGKKKKEFKRVRIRC